MFFYVKGVCMMCHETTQVRSINLYVIGSEGFYCCASCENKLLEFIRKERHKATKKKIRLFKKARKCGAFFPF
jgi:hypothetical protein